MTVSNEFPFQWGKSSDIRPRLILLGRKALSNRILNAEAESLNTLQENMLSNDSFGVILTLDDGKMF